MNAQELAATLTTDPVIAAAVVVAADVDPESVAVATGIMKREGCIAAIAYLANIVREHAASGECPECGRKAAFSFCGVCFRCAEGAVHGYERFGGEA